MSVAWSHKQDEIYKYTERCKLHVAENDCIAILLNEITRDAPARQDNKIFQNDETPH